jgi:hypothetical protein
MSVFSGTVLLNRLYLRRRGAISVDKNNNKSVLLNQIHPLALWSSFIPWLKIKRALKLMD